MKRRKVNQLSDELKLQVVNEYLSTDISQEELKKKYNFGGSNNIQNWMLKFGISYPEEDQIKLPKVMSKEIKKSGSEEELERKIKKLEEELKYEKFKTVALNTLIDVAERELKVDIRKKPGAKR